MKCSVIRTQTTTNLVHDRLSFRKSLMRQTHGTLMQTLSLPWMHSAARRLTRWWTHFLEVSAAALPFAASSCRSRTFSCLMNLQTTLMQKRLTGLNATCATTAALSLQLHMTVTSLIMLPAGFLNLTAEKDMRSRESVLYGFGGKRTVLGRMRRTN